MDSDFYNNNATNCKSGVKRRAVDDIQNNISQVIESVIATSVNLVVLIFSCFSFEHKFNDGSKEFQKSVECEKIGVCYRS